MSQESLSAQELPAIQVREGVELRLLTKQNADEMYASVLKNQDHLAPWVFWAGDSFSSEKNLEMLAQNEAGYKSGTAYATGIYVDGKLAGSTDIRDIGSSNGAEIGYWIDKDYLGQNLATDAAEALITFARSRHDIPKIVLHTMVGNEASSRVAEKLGFSFDKVIKNQEQGIEEKRYVKEYE